MSGTHMLMRPTDSLELIEPWQSEAFQEAAHSFGQTVGVAPTVYFETRQLYEPGADYPSFDELLTETFADTDGNLPPAFDTHGDLENKLLQACHTAYTSHGQPKVYSGGIEAKYQLRKSGRPFIKHPFEALKVAIEIGIEDEDMLSAIVLHDVVEDTEVSIQEIIAQFGERVGRFVSLMTYVKGQDDANQSYDGRNLSKVVPNFPALLLKNLPDIGTNVLESRLNDERGVQAMLKHAGAAYGLTQATLYILEHASEDTMDSGDPATRVFDILKPKNQDKIRIAGAAMLDYCKLIVVEYSNPAEQEKELAILEAKAAQYLQSANESYNLGARPHVIAA